MRLIYMLLFAVCLQVASFVMWVVVTVQFVFALSPVKTMLTCGILAVVYPVIFISPCCFNL